MWIYLIWVYVLCVVALKFVGNSVVYYFLKPLSYGNLWLSYSICIFFIPCVYLNQIRLTFYFNQFFKRTVIKIWSSGNSGGAPWWSYWSAGITNTIGPAMGIEALKYISYPAQVWFLQHLFFPHLFYLKVISISKSISVLCTKIHSSFLKINEITILQIMDGNIHKLSLPRI